MQDASILLGPSFLASRMLWLCRGPMAFMRVGMAGARSVGAEAVAPMMPCQGLYAKHGGAGRLSQERLGLQHRAAMDEGVPDPAYEASTLTATRAEKAQREAPTWRRYRAALRAWSCTGPWAMGIQGAERNSSPTPYIYIYKYNWNLGAALRAASILPLNMCATWTYGRSKTRILRF